jgi:hypothetical protein
MDVNDESRTESAGSPFWMALNNSSGDKGVTNP